jgi:predicted permease
MNRDEFNLAKLIIREQRYFSLKGFARKTLKKNGRSLGSYVRRNYIASIISFSILSVGLSGIKYLESPTGSTLTEVIVVLFFYLLLTGGYNALFFFSQIKMGKIAEYSMHLPNVRIERTMTLSFLYYYATSTAFIVIPAAFGYAIIYDDLAAFFLIMFWVAIYLVLGLFLGSIVLLLSGEGMFKRKKGSKRYLSMALKAGFAILAFLLFEVWIYDPSLLPTTYFSSFSYIGSLLPIINVASTSFYVHTWDEAAIAFFSFAIYAVLAVLSLRGSEYFLMKFFTKPGKPSKEVTAPAGFMHTSGIGSSLIRKDTAIVFRSPQNSIMLFFPILLSVPVIIPFAIASNFSALGLYYVMLEFPVICASFFPIIMLMAEGKGITSVFSLPLDRFRFLGSKFSLSLIIFLAASISIITVIAAFGKEPLFSLVITEISIVCGFVYVLIINLIRNADHINDAVTILNFDSFGGNMGLMMTFARSLLLLLIPALAVDAIVYLKYYSFSNSTLILGLDAFVNAVIMVAIVIYGRKNALGRAIAAFT